MDRISTIINPSKNKSLMVFVILIDLHQELNIYTPTI